MRLLSLIVLIVLSGSIPFCAYAQNEDVIVLQKGEWLPANAKPLGTVKVGKPGKSHSSYEVNLKVISMQAIQKGANVLMIKKVIGTSGSVNSVTIKGDIYHIDDLKSYKLAKKRRSDSIAKTFISGTEPYALLYIYQPSHNVVGRKLGSSNEISPLVGMAWDLTVNCQLLLDDLFLFNLRSYKKQLFQIDTPGKRRLWTDCDPQFDKQLDVKPGNIYFIHIDVGKNRPEIVDADRAIAESAQLKWSK